MGHFEKVASNAFESIIIKSGMLLTTFDPAHPAEPTDAQIITATTGGITASCVPEFQDFGEDIDNVMKNSKELKMQTGWTCTLSSTALNITSDTLKFLLGAADVDATTSAIVPRKELESTDFSDIWFVSNRVDGKVFAIKIKNALSTAGFSITTTKEGKGTLPFTITGHVSIADQEEMPMEFYASVTV